MIGKSGSPSRLTPVVTARMISPSVHPRKPAGVMFLAKKSPGNPRFVP